MDCSSKDNFDKEAGNRIEFSVQSVSQMEENMNNERLKYTQAVFPVLSYSSPSFCSSLSPLSVPVYYFQSCFIWKKGLPEMCPEYQALNNFSKDCC